MDTVVIVALVSGLLVRSSNSLRSVLLSPLCKGIQFAENVSSIASVATLFQRLPNLKLAVPISDIEYTPPTKDLGIIKLPILLNRGYLLNLLTRLI